MARLIGVRHRRKSLVLEEEDEGKRQELPRMTFITIEDIDRTVTYECKTDTEELDFVLQRYPVEWRSLTTGDDVSSYFPRHCKWRKLTKGEKPDRFPGGWTRQTEDPKEFEIVTHVPTRFEGLDHGDRVVMSLGGAGDRFAFACSRRGEEIGAQVYRVPPFALAKWRARWGSTTDDDHRTVMRLYRECPELFYRVYRRHRDVIAVKEAFQLRMDTLKERIACGQRFAQRFIGAVFLTEEGKYPEGLIEDEADRQRANSTSYRALLDEEKERDRELERAVKATDVWNNLFETVEGCGPRIAAGLIAAIGVVSRFEVPPDLSGMADPKEIAQRTRRARKKGQAKLKAFLGVHVRQGGKYAGIPQDRQFPRRRSGEVANWHSVGRQSLILLADQFNRHPQSLWGQRLRENKARLLKAHPEIVLVEKKGKQVRRYTKMHLHRMGIWRTLSRFVEWLYDEWIKLEHGALPDAGNRGAEDAA